LQKTAVGGFLYVPNVLAIDAGGGYHVYPNATGELDLLGNYPATRLSNGSTGASSSCT
jgi:hypothetical protein